MSELRAWLDRFDAHLRDERRLAPLTRRHYRRDLDAFAGHCEAAGLTEWKAVDAGHVRHFVAARHRAGLGGRSLARGLSALRSLFRFLIREQAATHDPAAGIQAPKAPRRLPETLDVDETARLLDAVPGVDPLLRRDVALFELAYSSGLRLAELAALEASAVAHDPEEIEVIGKGAKSRIVPVGRKARAALATWLAARPAVAAPGEPALFVSRRGRRLSHRAIQQRLAALAHRQGLGRPVHPHMLRHAFASHLLESSGELRAVQELLGHANLATTQIYTHLDFQHLAEVYDRAHPRARRK